MRPTTIVRERATTRVGDLSVELHHSLGETDDHLWGWIPDLEAVLAGDFLTWVFPNAGNPQKVQRYPREWAAALRRWWRAAKLLLPPTASPSAEPTSWRGSSTTWPTCSSSSSPMSWS